MSLSLPKSLGLTSARVFGSLEKGLAAAGLTVISASRVREKLAPHGGLQGCQTSACLQRIGQILGAPLAAQVAGGAEDGRIRLTVVLSWTQTRAPPIRQSQTCAAPCDAERVQQIITALADRAARQALATRNVRGQPGVAGPRGARPHAKARRARWLRISGIVALSVGASLAGAGGLLIGLHGVEARRDEHSFYTYDTRTAGITMTAVGAASLVAGAVLLVYGLFTDEEVAPPVTVTLVSGSAVVGVAGRF